LAERVARLSRRRVVGLVGFSAAGLFVAACGGAAPPTVAPPKPTDAPKSAAPPATSAPAATSQPAAGAATSPPVATKPGAAPVASPAVGGGTPLVGAGIGGAQPTAVPTPAGDLKNPAEFLPPRTKAASPTTLTFWQYVGFHVAVQKFIAEEYKKRFDPNLSLEITAYPGLNEQRTAVKAALAAASPTPDIIAVEPGAYAVDVYTAGGVIGFNKVFQDDPKFKEGFWPNAIQLLTVNGETVSVPVVTNTVAMYYNKRLFADAGAKVPETLDDLKALAKVFNDKGIAPIAYPAGQDRNYPIFPFYMAAGGLEADKLMRDADLGKAPWTSDQLVQAAQVAEELAKSGLYAKGPLGIKEPDGIQIFAGGKSAMFFAGQWMRTSIRQAIAPDFDLGLFPFPAIKAGGKKPVLSSVGITLTVNKNSKNPDLAFEMIKAITGAWGKIEYSKGLGISPNGPISADAVAYQMQTLKDPLYPEFLKLQPTGTSRVLFTPQVEEAMYQGMQAVIQGSKGAKAVMDDVEAASKKAGERKFTVG
jgi:ABC-type glycerol-3-phosphate transport system substrate-binding protein